MFLLTYATLRQIPPPAILQQGHEQVLEDKNTLQILTAKSIFLLCQRPWALMIQTVAKAKPIGMISKFNYFVVNVNFVYTFTAIEDLKKWSLVAAVKVTLRGAVMHQNYRSITSLPLFVIKNIISARLPRWSSKNILSFVSKEKFQRSRADFSCSSFLQTSFQQRKQIHAILLM